MLTYIDTYRAGLAHSQTGNRSNEVLGIGRRADEMRQEWAPPAPACRRTTAHKRTWGTGGGGKKETQEGGKSDEGTASFIDRVVWKGCRKQLPKSPFSAPLSQIHRYMR
jgi:hypothetical protein